MEAAATGLPALSMVDPMLELMPVGLYILDGGWRFTYANAEAEHLIGRRREEVVGQSLWDAFPAAVGTEIEVFYRRARATGESVSFETYYPEPLNAWYDVRALPGPDGLSVFFLEVSERRLAQERAQTAGDRLALRARAVPGGCIVTAVDDRGHLVHAGSWHVDPAARAQLKTAARRARTVPG